MVAGRRSLTDTATAQDMEEPDIPLHFKWSSLLTWTFLDIPSNVEEWLNCGLHEASQMAQNREQWRKSVKATAELSYGVRRVTEPLFTPQSQLSSYIFRGILQATYLKLPSISVNISV